MTTNLAPLKIGAILKKYGLQPDKSLGQNFLADEVALQRVVDAAGIEADQAVLEIGAGLGSLTRHLACVSSLVIAVELDDKLIPPLKEVLSAFENIHIICGDILDLQPDELISNSQSPTTNYLVVANIPYYITSAIIRHVLEAETKPQRMVLTVQGEVAQRMCAAPGKLSLLALSVQVYGHPEIVARVPAGAFYPAPKVDSAVVRIALFPEPTIPTPLLPLFFRLAKSGFSQKRKTLLNSISAGMAWPKDATRHQLDKAAIDPRRRAETLSIEEWGALTQQVSENFPPKSLTKSNATPNA
jgi:16S rRNA (adenine1518-N6/adenine1519-N6)-dimethyltransferase